LVLRPKYNPETSGDRHAADSLILLIHPMVPGRLYTRDRNMYLSKADGSNEMVITKDANEENQIKYGIATWVYGEELRQTTAMWWSPDSKKVAFYKFVEKGCKKILRSI
jgi:hypothetical protein